MMKNYRVKAASFAYIFYSYSVLSLMVAHSVNGAEIPFAERVISTTADLANSVFAIDLDGDGDIDVLSASTNDDKIAWYENDGGSPPTFTERVISTIADGARSVYATDLDGDGNVDVLSASQNDDKIAWYESDGGSPPMFTEHIISTIADLAGSVLTADLNGDGDIDVLSASFFGVTTWYENDGSSPPTFTGRTISDNSVGAASVFAVDLDNDKDVDILSALILLDRIEWYENDGGSPPTFTDHIISTTAFGAHSVFAKDINGDGDMDVLSASFDDHKIAWYENDGNSPPTFTEWIISTTAFGATSVFAIDMNGDGNPDVLSASFDGDKITWYESDGNSPPTFTEHVISTDADDPVSVFAIDMDSDGDIDVLSASQRDDKIAWYENTTCGDGVIVGGEECDDGNTENGDGCSASCMIEPQYICNGEPSICIIGIPTVSTWGLIVMMLLLATVGTLFINGYKSKTTL